MLTPEETVLASQPHSGWLRHISIQLLSFCYVDVLDFDPFLFWPFTYTPVRTLMKDPRDLAICQRANIGTGNMDTMAVNQPKEMAYPG